MKKLPALKTWGPGKIFGLFMWRFYTLGNKTFNYQGETMKFILADENVSNHNCLLIFLKYVYFVVYVLFKIVILFLIFSIWLSYNSCNIQKDLHWEYIESKGRLLPVGVWHNIQNFQTTPLKLPKNFKLLGPKLVVLPISCRLQFFSWLTKEGKHKLWVSKLRR